MRTLHPLTTAALAVVVTVVTLSACGHTPPESGTAGPAPLGRFNEAHWVQPYGGCKEAARYPGTPGFRQCARHGLLPHPTHPVTNHLLPAGGGSW